MARQSARALWAAKLSGKTIPGPSSESARAAPRTPFKGVVLGIDPSLRGTGLAALCFARRPEGELLFSLTIRTAATLKMPECLGQIFTAVQESIVRANPVWVAVEQTIYVQNFQTAQILGAARGAALAAAAVSGIQIAEYSPLRIKQAVVGFGRASKEQVVKQIMGLLNLPSPLPLDESDAAAVALCHALTWRP